MVDMDKHACHQLAENGYKNGQWPESYITWEFLTEHPRAMESGYIHIEWNSIPRLYNRKSYLRTLVIEKGSGITLAILLNWSITGSLPKTLMTSTRLWDWLYAGPPFMIARKRGEGKNMSCRLPSCENRHGISDYHLQQLLGSSGMTLR